MADSAGVPRDPATHDALAVSHLRTLPDEVRAGLLANARRQAFAAGGVIRREGDGRPHLDLVTAGLVRVFVAAPDGRTLTVRYVRTGGLLGAVSLFASRFVLPGTIQAVTAAEMVRFDPAQVRQAADREVVVARALIDELSERVLAFIPEIPGSAFGTVRQRVARHLLDLASTVPDRGLVAEISQQELSDAVGSVREVVVRVLRQLRDDGLIQTGRDGVVVLDAERLARQAYPGGVGEAEHGGGTKVPDTTVDRPHDDVTGSPDGLHIA
jgi:CRP/FNR family transcriptional regulator, cyclic AMP receptor protein